MDCEAMIKYEGRFGSGLYKSRYDKLMLMPDYTNEELKKACYPIRKMYFKATLQIGKTKIIFDRKLKNFDHAYFACCSMARKWNLKIIKWNANELVQ